MAESQPYRRRIHQGTFGQGCGESGVANEIPNNRVVNGDPRHSDDRLVIITTCGGRKEDN